jgi:flagellar biosynthesis protein FlhB
MADQSQDQGEKTEDPTAHRIEQFRKRGEVASSKELTSVLVLAAAFLTLSLSLVYIYETLGVYVEWLYGLDISKAYTEKSLKLIFNKTATAALESVAPLFFVVMAVGVFANVGQIGFLFSTEVLQFKPERVNPLSGVKRLFSMKSFVEAIKGIFKFTFILCIVYFNLKDDINTLGGFLHLGFFAAFLHAKWIITKVGFGILAGLLLIAVSDYAYQKYSYWQKLKMTKEELKKENKDQDGSPEVKQRIKTIQREMAQKRMMTEIPNADVIITNPTHIAIVIQYDQETMISPTVIGKGADHLAMRIREIAKKHNIPIVENVPLARTLYKTVSSGAAVPRALYKTVAEVLAFVYKLKRKRSALESHV